MMSSMALHNRILQTYVTVQNACFMHRLQRCNSQLLALRGHSTVCQGSGVIVKCGQEPDRACASGTKPQEPGYMAPPKVLKARICFCLSGQCLQTNQSSRGSLQTRRRQKCSLKQADLRRFGGYC